jgi:hypothetical protein
MKRFLDWLAFRQLTWAANVVRKHGYTLARIKTVAGTDYICDSVGGMHRIGYSKEKKK